MLFLSSPTKRNYFTGIISLQLETKTLNLQGLHLTFEAQRLGLTQIIIRPTVDPMSDAADIAFSLSTDPSFAVFIQTSSKSWTDSLTSSISPSSTLQLKMTSP